MFGIGLPELILIMGIALIVVGPEKLPGLAKSIAKQVLELKKAANLFKDSLHDEIGSDKPVDKDLPPGFSRPEELAAAARDSIEENKDKAPDLSANNSEDPYKDVEEDDLQENSTPKVDSENA